MTEAVEQWQGIKARMAGRGALIAVSKTFGPEDITPIITAGQRLFGENRVQEAQAKWPALRARFTDIELHLIGPLQSNKAAEAVALFDVIQTLDRPKIAQALAKEMQKQGRHLPCFIQVNIGREAQKAGIAPDGVTEFLNLCRQSHGLNIIGLMCIPPVEGDPRPHFKALAQMAAKSGLKNLSMGMSGDFEIALEEGATHVRVGSAIFGGRPQISK
jgi:PLP dependent protein